MFKKWQIVVLELIIDIGQIVMLFLKLFNVIDIEWSLVFVPIYFDLALTILYGAYLYLRKKHNGDK